MHSQEIRQKFLDYFEKKGHAVVPSSPTVPLDDPTLLFTNAGMNQFKDVFLGETSRDYSCATTSQKCVRVGGKHNDLDNVGHTTRHMTFFEMLGNFSFGDYFKKEAIAYAWEFTTEVLGFTPNDLWVSVFDKDDEAFDLWKAHIDESRIVRIGEKDNFWSMGDVGPCGPCSEIFFDRGPKYGSATSPKDDTEGERFLEFWNLVFMQYNRDKSGKMTPLPKQSVDTGMGLERIAMLKQGVDSVFQTDILTALIRRLEKRFSLKYEGQAAFHVIADHLRTLAFAIADGAQPSNVDRGYVLRKLLRRAVRYGRLLGLQKPFLGELLPTLLEEMPFPELKTAEKRIAEILHAEEESFFATLRRGGHLLQSIIETTTKEISGEDAFKLKDTYGFPIEEILLIAKDSGLTVNLEAYSLLEEEARERSRGARNVEGQTAKGNLFADFGEETLFVGYKEHEADATVVALIQNDTFVDTLETGAKGIVVLDTTPFYAEKGGQVADHGTLSNVDAIFTVTDCQAPMPNITCHIGTLERGSLKVGDPLFAAIDSKRRHEIENHHTATHLLHYALYQVLGEHIRQAGSLVEREKLRFDFNHHKPVTTEELRTIERIVNAMIREGKTVETYELAFAEVQNQPEIKQFFGDKYGQEVRVVDIEEAKELCGGTHADTTARIGLFRIVKEGSIAKGVRRIEAVTGFAAEQFMYAQEDKIDQKAAEFQKEKEALHAEIKQLQVGQRNALISELLAKKENDLLVAKVDIDPKQFAPLANDLMARMGSGALLLASKTQLAIRLSDDLVQKGLSAGALIKELAPLMGGSGGGKPGSAQAGGTDLAHFDTVAAKFTEQCAKN